MRDNYAASGDMPEWWVQVLIEFSSTRFNWTWFENHNSVRMDPQQLQVPFPNGMISPHLLGHGRALRALGQKNSGFLRLIPMDNLVLSSSPTLMVGTTCWRRDSFLFPDLPHFNVPFGFDLRSCLAIWSSEYTVLSNIDPSLISLLNSYQNSDSTLWVQHDYMMVLPTIWIPGCRNQRIAIWRHVASVPGFIMKGIVKLSFKDRKFCHLIVISSGRIGWWELWVIPELTVSDTSGKVATQYTNLEWNQFNRRCWSVFPLCSDIRYRDKEPTP